MADMESLIRRMDEVERRHVRSMLDAQRIRRAAQAVVWQARRLRAECDAKKVIAAAMRSEERSQEPRDLEELLKKK